MAEYLYKCTLQIFKVSTACYCFVECNIFPSCRKPCHFVK